MVAAKNKLRRFAENEKFNNLFQLNYEDVVNGFFLKNKWHSDFFKNENPIILELGCGKGEYTVGLAERYPDKNFIGIDIKGARIWRGLKTANEENISNLAFIRTRINLVHLCFGQNEVSGIWITFPDPHPKEIRTRKRLTSPQFLNLYRQFLKPGGIIHLKTDNIIFLEYTLDVIREEGYDVLYLTYDVYKEGLNNEVDQIQTYYENKWLKHGTKIKYLQFRFNK
jgi:tRNA (guanine-N7-)-methyltransferase